MALRTSVGSGLWSSPATWNTGVPADGDSFTIATGHVVTFDVDQSGMTTGMTAGTINGTLAFKHDGNTYFKWGGSGTANVSGTGTLTIGTAANPIQRAYSATIEAASTGGVFDAVAFAVVNICGWTPSNGRNHTTLASNQGFGSTTLLLSDDLELQAGDIVCVGHMLQNSLGTWTAAETAKGCYTVQSYNSGTRTVTLTSGLLLDRVAGDIVCMVNRNILFTRSVASSSAYYLTLGVTTSSQLLVRGVWLASASLGCRGIASAPAGTRIQFCTIDGAGLALSLFNLNNNLIVEDCSAVRGCSWSLPYPATLLRVAGVGFAGGLGRYNENCAFSVCSTAIGGGNGYIKNTTIHNVGTGLTTQARSVFKNVTIVNRYTSTGYASFSGASTLVAAAGFLAVDVVIDDTTIRPAFFGDASGRFVNCRFGSVERGVVRSYDLEGSYIDSIHHNQVSGAYRAWSKGGITSSVVDVVPPGKSRSYMLVMQSATSYGFMQIPATVGPGETLRVRCHVRKSLAMSEPPSVQVVNPQADPLVDSAHSPLSSVAMTDSVDTWELVGTSWTNTTDAPVEVLIRCLGKNATGNVWFYPEWSVGANRWANMGCS